jgi:hypothetical protein
MRGSASAGFESPPANRPNGVSPDAPIPRLARTIPAGDTTESLSPHPRLQPRHREGCHTSLDRRYAGSASLDRHSKAVERRRGRPSADAPPPDGVGYRGPDTPSVGYDRHPSSGHSAFRRLGGTRSEPCPPREAERGRRNDTGERRFLRREGDQRRKPRLALDGRDGDIDGIDSPLRLFAHGRTRRTSRDTNTDSR